RDLTVTGVQTCALPISHTGAGGSTVLLPSGLVLVFGGGKSFGDAQLTFFFDWRASTPMPDGSLAPGRWIPAAPMPDKGQADINSSAVLTEGTVVAAGGNRFIDGIGFGLTDSFVYDVAAGKWSRTATDLNEPRAMVQIVR